MTVMVMGEKTLIAMGEKSWVRSQVIRPDGHES